MSNLRFALRQLLKSPGFALTAIGTLAIAIAVNATVFAALRVILFQPVSEANPGEVTGIFPNRPTARGNDYRRFSYAEYQALREAKDAFREITAFYPTLAGVGEGENARRCLSILVSPNFFSFYGVSVLQGRPFTEEECRPGAAQKVAIASHAYWQRQGGRAEFLGSTLRISGQTYTVVGIAPPRFSGLNALIVPDLFFPLGTFAHLGGGLGDELPANADLGNPTFFKLSINARLAAGVTAESLKPRLADLSARVWAAAPLEGEEAAAGARKLELAEQSRFGISDSPDEGGVSLALGGVLQGMAVLVLLVASLNLANLLLARGAVRKREIAVRMAIGATRGHIIRQLLVEGAVLAVLGGALGAWLGSLGMEAAIASLMSSVAPNSFTFSLGFDARPDFTVTLAVAAFCACATLVFSLGPALSLSRGQLALDMKTGAAQEGTGRRGWRALLGARNLLVATQLALALALLFTAAQFFRGGLKLAARPLGFDASRKVLLEVDYGVARVPQPELAARFARLRQQAEALPGVQSATFSTLVPFDNSNTSRRAVGLGPQAVEPPAGKAPGSYGSFTAVDAGYFQQMSIPLTSGRDFTAAENEPGANAKVVIIDEKLARRLFKDGLGLGRRLRLTDGERAGEYDIIGVVRSPWHDYSSEPEPPSRIYLPFGQEPGKASFLLVQLRGSERAAQLALLQTIRRELVRWDSSALVLQAMPLTDFVARNAILWLIQSTALLFGIFAFVALVLAVVGVYGVTSYLVARRTRELGLRMALGSTARQVLGLVLGQGALQAGAAVTAGTLLAIALAKILGSQLDMLPPVNLWALLGCAAFLFAAAVLAGLPPARRAARIQPTEALKAE